ncbi:MAG: hypothetical protein ACT4P6_16760 [Gemmatimonadaceae bacterium]
MLPALRVRISAIPQCDTAISGGIENYCRDMGPRRGGIYGVMSYLLGSTRVSWACGALESLLYDGVGARDARTFDRFGSHAALGLMSSQR